VQPLALDQRRELSRAPQIRAVGVVSPAKLAGVALIARVSGNSRLGSHRA
jgi:hypothetical protein